jgi:AraC-like DNA-binding protein
MKIETFYPEQTLLKNFIQYYYFQKTENSDFKTNYYAFPNLIQTLNIHKNVSCEIESHQVKIIGIEKDNYVMILQGRFQLPLNVEQEGKIDKLTIVFKPLGLNHFIKSPYLNVSRNPTQIFEDWSDDNQYERFLFSFFEEPDNKKRIEILENFLLYKYSPVQDVKILNQAIDLLADVGRELSIDEIARRMHMNTRTFNRLIWKHLGISPVGFRKIARFRHSLKVKTLNTPFTSLTKIGYASNFYDQSYFNKVYKKITGDNPSGFFNSIERLADNQLILKFVEK